MRNARFRNVDRARRASAASCRRRASRTTSSSTSRPTRRSTEARATHEEPRHTAKTLLLHDRDGASRCCPRTAAVREEPLEAAGDRDSQDSRLPRRDQVRVRHTPGKGERVSRHKVMDPIADPEGDLPLKEHDLLILARVDVDREPVTERFLGLPSAEPSVALRRLHVNDDHGAGEPDTGRNQGRGSIARLCQGGQSSRELSAALRDQRERRRAGRRLPRCIGSSASGVGSLALTLVVCRFQLRLRARRECRSAAARGDSAYFMRSSAVICRTTSDPVSTWRSKSRCRSCLRCSSRSFGVATGSPSLSLSPNDTPRLSFYPRLMSMGLNRLVQRAERMGTRCGSR